MSKCAIHRQVKYSDDGAIVEECPFCEIVRLSGILKEFPGVIPHKRVPATREVPQMVICHTDVMSNRIIIDITFIDSETTVEQFRGFIKARESGELAQLIQRMIDDA